MRTKLMATILTLGLTGGVVSSLSAQDDAPPPPPPLPEEPQQSTDIPEPEVKIIHKDDRTIEEYSVNGKVRYVKIIPSKGKPYYIVDTDGDGQVDTSFKDLENPPINQWILWQW